MDTDTRRDPATATNDSPPENPRQREGRIAAGLPFGIAIVLAVLLTVFAWPALNSAPRGVDIGVVAPEQAVEQIAAGIEQNAGDDAFEITRFDDREAAVAAIENREVYGALVLSPDGGEMLVASAASPVVAQLLTQMGAALPPEAGGPLAVTDLVTFTADDPRGVGLSVGLFPLLIGGIALGAASANLLRRTRHVVLTLTLGAAVAGLTVVGLLQGWLGALDGSYWALSGTAALMILAMSATVAGLYRQLGVAGIGIGALLMMFIGNPLSGLASAPEMLPTGLGTLGQWLPPGAGGTALRSVAFFGGAGSAMAFVALACWAALGLALLLVPRRRAAA